MQLGNFLGAKDILIGNEPPLKECRFIFQRSFTSTFHPYQAEHIAEPLCLAMIEHVGIWGVKGWVTLYLTIYTP